MAVLLVRHAVALSRRSWPGDDADRPLDDRGRRQAAALVGLLASFDVVRVLSSPAVRCTATVAPLASPRGLEVEPEDDLFEGNGHRGAVRIRSFLAHDTDLATPTGGAIVLCSHGDVIPDVLVELEQHGADLGDDRRCQKGSTWVLERRPDGALAGRYLPPPT